MSNLIDDILGYGIKKDLERFRQEIYILILGAYNPDAKERLYGLRDCLRKRGYKNTFLVENCSDDIKLDDDLDIHWELKSNQLMHNFDLNFFVFFANCNNEGVTDELNYFCNNIEEFFRCYIICENSYSINISTRIKAKIKKHRLHNTKIEDNDDEDLCDAAYGFVEMMLKRHRQKIFKHYVDY